MLPDNAAEEARQNRHENQLDRRKVAEKTRDELAEAIAVVDDPDAREALSLLMEIVCGEVPSERRSGNNRSNSSTSR